MASEVSLAPDFIRFLFSTKPKFDCYFTVGNISQGNPERIGAVKLMLMAHSEVFRLQLEDSELREKKDVKVEDVHPGTFRGMLKYIYGHDTTSEIGFDDADNMLYVAEKYMMQTLKDKLAMRLMELLNPDNICSLLNNPACYKHLELDSAITQILRFETDLVLNSQQLLWMNAEGFLKILEQDGLAVPEIELWRAAIKWAKHKANSEDRQLLRQQMSSFAKHLRLCTFVGDELFEAATANILTTDELGIVCQSIGNKRKPDHLNDFSDEILPRIRLDVSMKPSMQRMFGYSMQKQYKLELTNHKIGSDQVAMTYNFTLLTKQNSVELLPLVCLFKEDIKVDCTTTITKAADAHNAASSSTSKPPITAEYSENMKIQVPLTVDGHNVVLLPHTKYTCKVTLRGPHRRYCSSHAQTYTDDHLTLSIICNVNGDYYFPSDKLEYRIH